MRLPADATLVVAGAAPAGPWAQNVDALIAAWRAGGLPILHFGAADAPPRETMTDTFDETAFEQALDAFGTTAVVLCGAGPLLGRVAEAAAGFGCHVFVPADACDQADLAPIEAAEAMSGGDRARLTDTAAVLAAASLAAARRRAAARR